MSTTISEMTLYNIEEILPLYIDYYNNNEGACWARDTASKRIHQVLSIEDSYSLILRDEGNAANFVMKVKWIA